MHFARSRGPLMTPRRDVTFHRRFRRGPRRALRWVVPGGGHLCEFEADTTHGRALRGVCLTLVVRSTVTLWKGPWAPRMQHTIFDGLTGS